MHAFAVGLPEELMHKLSLEGWVGFPQIFKVGTEFQKGGAPCSGNVTARSSTLGVAINPTLQAGEEQSRKELDEEDEREKESPSQGSSWMFMLSESPWWSWGKGYRGLSDANISDPSSRSDLPVEDGLEGWTKHIHSRFNETVNVSKYCQNLCLGHEFKENKAWPLPSRCSKLHRRQDHKQHC